MLIIDIIIFIVILVILLSFLNKTKEHFDLELVTYRKWAKDGTQVRDCDEIDKLVENNQGYSDLGSGRSWVPYKPCETEERTMSDLNKKIQNVLNMPVNKTPLSSKNYKKFFKENEIGIKPKCIGHECHYWEGRGKKEGRDKLNNFLKNKNEQIDYIIKKKKFRNEEIDIEMEHYDMLSKIENVIGTRQKMTSNILGLWKSTSGKSNDVQESDGDITIKNKSEFNRILSRIIRAKIFLKDNNNSIIFITHSEIYSPDNSWERIYYKIKFGNTADDDDLYYYIEDKLKKNNIPITTNEKC
tara:strand:+ start:1172 stop:2068 length:897 start_codon:yes stop_codon:yes gene_type:complete